MDPREALGGRLCRTLLCVALSAATALAACGGDDEVKTGSTRLVPPGTKLSRLDISLSEPRPRRFRYHAPRTVRGGLVQIRFRNSGKSPRKAQLWRVGGGHSIKEAIGRRRGRGLPSWLSWAGGVGLTRPGGTGTAIQRLSPGHYYVTGLGGERRGIAPLRVTAGAPGAAPPAPGARITAIDYGYRFTGLKAGPTATEFRNAGREPHHAYFAPMRDGRTLAEVKAFFAGRLTGPPPVDTKGTRESVVLEGRDRQLTRLNLESGRYAVLCFVSDRAGGPQHVQKGMVAEVKVP